MRPSTGNLLQAKSLEHLVYGSVTLHAFPGLRRELQVLPHSHVGEQGVVLQYVSAPPLLGSSIDAGLRVKQQDIVEEDSSAVRASQSGDAIEHQRLPRSAWPEERCYTSASPKRNIKRERCRLTSDRKALHQCGFDHRGCGRETNQPPPILLANIRIVRAIAETTNTSTRAT
jgi:hypothetical protein